MRNALQAYLTGHWLTDLANFSALVLQELPDLNWAGFYLDHGDKLRLGPFVGKPACTEIAYGRGVCGSSFSSEKPLLVADVHEFPGHIACDSASRSEMVIPLSVSGRKLGVFDLDSPLSGRFTQQDLRQVEDGLSLLINKVPADVWLRYPWKS